jgi:hypothetical protein
MGRGVLEVKTKGNWSQQYCDNFYYLTMPVQLQMLYNDGIRNGKMNMIKMGKKAVMAYLKVLLYYPGIRLERFKPCTY